MTAPTPPQALRLRPPYAIGLAGCLAVGLVWTGTAIAGPRAAPASADAPTIVRSAGVAKPTAIDAPSPLAGASHKALTRSAKLELAAKAGLATALDQLPVQVSAAQPKVASRMSLMLVEPGIVNPDANYIEFPAKGVNSVMENMGSYAGLWVKSAAAGEKTLIDCAIGVEKRPGKPNSKVKVKFEDKTSTTLTLPNGNHHISWILDSPDAGWHAFQINSMSRWSLTMCEATPL